MSASSYHRRRVSRRNQLLTLIIALVLLGLIWFWPFGPIEASPLPTYLVAPLKSIFTGILGVLAAINGWLLLRYIVKFGFAKF